MVEGQELLGFAVVDQFVIARIHRLIFAELVARGHLQYQLVAIQPLYGDKFRFFAPELINGVRIRTANGDRQAVFIEGIGRALRPDAQRSQLVHYRYEQSVLRHVTVSRRQRRGEKIQFSRSDGRLA